MFLTSFNVLYLASCSARNISCDPRNKHLTTSVNSHPDGNPNFNLEEQLPSDAEDIESAPQSEDDGESQSGDQEDET